jgi:hypothetical protein
LFNALKLLMACLAEQQDHAAIVRRLGLFNLGSRGSATATEAIANLSSRLAKNLAKNLAKTIDMENRPSAAGRFSREPHPSETPA